MTGVYLAYRGLPGKSFFPPQGAESSIKGKAEIFISAFAT